MVRESLPRACCLEMSRTKRTAALYNLTHNVRIPDEPVHRDKEIEKIRNCTRSVRWTV